MRLTKTFTVLATGSALMIGAPAALAQSPAQTGYSQPGGVIQQQLATPNSPAPAGTPAAATQKTAPVASVTPAQSTTPAATTQSNQLPFTGLDVGLAVFAGVLLLAMGFVIRRLSRFGGHA